MGAQRRNFGGIAHGQVTVAAPGTAEQLPDQRLPNSVGVVITALPDNAGNVYVGNGDVDSTNGDVLTADTSISLTVDNTNKVFIDADNAGEGVSWIAEVDA